MAKTIFGEGTVTLVVLIERPGRKPEVARKFRVSGQADIARYFPVKDGVPVVGPRVYRELTNAELVRMGRPAGFKRTNYLECLVPALPGRPGAQAGGKDDRAA